MAKRKKGDVPGVTVVLEEPEHPTIVAFDPGVSTGWCVMQVHRDALDPKLGANGVVGDCAILDNILVHTYGTFESGGTDEGEARVAHLQMDLCMMWPHAVVLMEDFTLRKLSQDRDLLSPVRQNAMLLVLLYNKNRPWVKRSPSTGKNTVSDERLVRWGFKLSPVTHENDARRHALGLFKTAKFNPYLAEKLWRQLWVQDDQ